MNWRTRKLTASLYYDGVLKNTLTEELAFTFNTSEAVSGALNEANVVISGLKTDTMFSNVEYAVGQKLGAKPSGD